MSQTVNLAYDFLYNLPYRYRIEIYDAGENNLLYVSDGFNPALSTIAVENIKVNQAQWATWDASIQIDDSVYNIIDDSVLDNGTVMKIYLGKTQQTTQNIFYGIIDTIGTARSEGDLLKYGVNAKGFGVITNYTLVNFQKIPPPDTFKNGQILDTVATIPFFANNLVKSLWGDLDIMPLLDYTLSQRFGKNFTLNFVSDSVKDFIPGINNPLVTAAQLMNTISQMSGAVWYVDENKQLIFKYPYSDYSGIIVKDYWEATDSGDYTAYVKDGSSFGYTDSTRPDDGFANQLFAVADKTEQLGYNSNAVAFTSLYNKNIAFAVIADSSKFKNMSFVMSKVGPGSNATNPAIAKVYGYIVKDKNQSPTGSLIASFTISISDISETATPIVKIDRPQFADVVVGDIYWFVFLETGSDEKNTVRLWHDDDITTPSSLTRLRLSAQRLGNDVDLSNLGSDGWFVSNQGPEYSISYASTQSIIVEASDPLSIDRWTPNRPVQARVTIPSMKNIQAAQAYLQLIVYQTSQKIRNYDSIDVSIPNILIKPGTTIQLASNRLKDLAFENNRIAIPNSVGYNLDVRNYSIGSKYCSLSLKGSGSAIE